MALCQPVAPLRWCDVGGGVRIRPENARLSGRHGVQYVAQCVACAALTLVVWQKITNLSWCDAAALLPAAGAGICWNPATPRPA